MSKYKLAIFDWDGCLAQTLEMWLKEYKRVIPKYGLSFSDKEIVNKFFGTSYSDVKKVGVKDPVEFYDHIMPNIRKNITTVSLYPNVEKVLKNLKQDKILLALVSSRDKATLSASLDFHHEIGSLFAVVVSGDDVVNLKPDPEPIEKALKNLNVKASEAIFIGDSPHDISAGIAAGVDTAVFYPDGHDLFYDEKSLRYLNSTYFVRDFKDLLSIIKGTNPH